MTRQSTHLYNCTVSECNAKNITIKYKWCIADCCIVAAISLDLNPHVIDLFCKEFLCCTTTSDSNTFQT